MLLLLCHFSCIIQCSKTIQCSKNESPGYFYALSYPHKPHFLFMFEWKIILRTLHPVGSWKSNNWLLSINILACTFTIWKMLFVSPSVTSTHVNCSLCCCSFAWLELVSHRCFMPKLLTGNAQKGWPYIQRLLVDLLQFLEPFLRNAELGVPVCLFLKTDFIICFHCKQIMMVPLILSCVICIGSFSV